LIPNHDPPAWISRPDKMGPSESSSRLDENEWKCAF
jgi:hypothetical protein